MIAAVVTLSFACLILMIALLVGSWMYREKHASNIHFREQFAIATIQRQRAEAELAALKPKRQKITVTPGERVRLFRQKDDGEWTA